MVLADPKNQPPKAPAPKEAAAFLPLWVASGMINITNNNSVGPAPPPKTQKSPVTQMRLNPMPGKISASITKAQLATLRIPGGVRFDCDAPQGWLDRFDSETRNTMARTCVVAFPTDHPEGVIVDLVSGKMFANVNGYRAPAPSHSQQPLGQGIQAVSR
jgi:hypothetical protein